MRRDPLQGLDSLLGQTGVQRPKIFNAYMPVAVPSALINPHNNRYYYDPYFADEINLVNW